MRAILSVLCFFSLFLGPSQAQTAISQDQDSITNALLREYSKKKEAIERQSFADSIKKSKIEESLHKIKRGSLSRKEELLNQLTVLDEKELKRQKQQKAEIDYLRKSVVSYPVEGFFGDTLFRIYNRYGSFSAEERAEAITKKIHKVAEGLRFSPDSLISVESEIGHDIFYKDLILLSISENDAMWNNTTKDSLAIRYVQKLRKEIQNYKSETSIAILTKEIGVAFLIVLLLSFFIYFILKLFRWTAIKIRQQRDSRFKGIRIKNYTLFDAGQEVKFLVSLNHFIKWVLIVLSVYITLPVLFGIFPWTQHYAETLIGYVINPVKGIANALWNYIPNFFTIIVIFFFFRYVLKALRYLKTEIETEELKIPGFYPDWASPTYQIARVLVIAFMVVVIFPYLPGNETPIFKGVSVFLGFLFTFSSAGSLSNIVAGLVLTYMRLFKIGDRVKIGEVSGDVIEKSLLVTRIRTIKNEIISIPNSTVMNSHTVNYSSDAPDKGLIIHTTVTIGYDVPWKKVHQALIDAALKTEWVQKIPLPFVLQTSLDDFYVAYQINAFTKEPNKQAVVYSFLHQNIQDTFNEQGIEILSPHYRAARDGNATTIPAHYLPKDYQAPPFVIRQTKGSEQKLNEDNPPA